MDSASPPAAIRRLGQNFLVDPNIVRKIVALAELSSTDTVLEIGPGRGFLTEALCRAAGHITAIEVDPRLHTFLSERTAHLANLTLVLGDALTCSIEHLPIGPLSSPISPTISPLHSYFGSCLKAIVSPAWS